MGRSALAVRLARSREFISFAFLLGKQSEPTKASFRLDTILCFHLLSDIFQAADHLREDLGALEALVDSATGTFAPGKDRPNEG